MNYHERIHRINNWQKSEEYALQCAGFLAIVKGLLSFAEQKLPDIQSIAASINNQTVRTVAATNSSMHRGYHCPSFVEDLVVGNIKRGSILTRLTSKSKSYFLYGFDKNDTMLWSKHFFNNMQVETEYLFHNDNSIYGITIDINGNLEVITEEVFDDNRLICYRYLLVVHGENGIEPIELRQEEYKYDCEGLLCCDWYTLHPAIYLLKYEKVTFTRKDGYLKQYWVERIIGNSHKEVIKKSEAYNILAERKA